MRRARLLMAAVVTAWVMGFLSTPGAAAEFTADVVITGPGDPYSFELHVKDPLYRLQKTQGPMHIPPFPSIVNRDTGITWGLNPQMKQYVEMEDLEKTILMNPLAGWAATRKGMTEKPGPVETVNGYECDTFLYSEPGKSDIAVKVWISKKLNHIIREERFGMNENPVLELRNIQEGPVDPALFEIPAGYTKMDMDGGPEPKPSEPPPSAPATSSSSDRDVPKPASQAVSSGNLIFILDASGSMWGQIEGKAKIVIAKEVMTGLIQDLPDDSVVGLVAYGHRRKGDCDDVEELVPLSKIDKSKLIKIIQGLNARGKTPIYRSARMTAERIKHLEDETTIILVSDGMETCDPDPCGLVKELKEAGIKFVMHVIGFDVTENEKEQLECMAEAGGGRYYTAANAGEFMAAAREVVRKTREQGFLRLTALRGEKIFSAAVEVMAAGENQVIKSGRTGTDPGRRGAPVEPGAYDLRFRDTDLAHQPEVWIRGVEVKAGETVERTAVFAEGGILRVKAVKNNAPAKTYVQVFHQQDDKYMGDGWTREDGSPAEYELLPGIYKIRLQDQSVKQRPEIWIDDVEVKPGETVERIATFGEGGILRVKAVKNNAPAKTYVQVFHQQDDKYMGDGWTREDGSPAEYELLPGIYKIRLQDQSVKQRPIVWIENVEVKADQTVERFATFVAGGVLKVTATKNGAPYKAYVKIFLQDDGKYMGDGWTREDGSPAEHNVLPGTYSAKVEDRADRSVREIREIQVQSGKATTVNASFPVEKEAPEPATKQTPEPAPAPEPPTGKAPATKTTGEASDSTTILNGEIPLMKGATVLKETTMGGSSRVDMEIPASPEEVVNFYKQAMSSKGWQPGMAVVQGPVGILQLQKDTSQIVIKSTLKGQKSTVNIAVMTQ